MPQSIVRFLQVYASVVMLLVTGVMAIGKEPGSARADFGNVESAVAHAAPLHARRVMSFDGNWQHAKFALAIEAAGLRHALPLAASRIGSPGTKICAQPSVRARQPS